MALSLSSIRKERVIKAPHVVLLAPEKIGKTTFACGTHFEGGKLIETGLNSPIVIPCTGEEGADDLGVPQFPACKSFTDITDALAALYSEEHNYRTVVLDSASAMEPLVWDAVCADNKVNSIELAGGNGGGYGKGYVEALKWWREILQGLDALRDAKGMSSIIVGHVRVRRFDDPNGESYDQYQFDINEKAANMMFRWADLILFANTKVIVKKEDKGFGQEKKRGIDATGGQRFLFTHKRPAHPGGGRGIFGRLPYELPLDWVSFTEAVKALV